MIKMRTEQEILEKIEAIKKEIVDVENWAEKASKNFMEDKKNWGKDADPGEMYHAWDVLSTLKKEVDTLNWVLNK
jgi:hypothetical protein